jgi:hypothetical protein
MVKYKIWQCNLLKKIDISIKKAGYKQISRIASADCLGAVGTPLGDPGA